MPCWNRAKSTKRSPAIGGPWNSSRTIPRRTTTSATRLLEQGKVEEAIACFRRALDLNPDNPEAHNNLGVALREQGKLDQAAAAHRRALELKPDYPEAHSNLGNVLKDRGMVDEAEACWRRALELKPDFVRTHNNLGIALKQQGKLDEAMASYRRALELKPDYAEAYNNLANALWEDGKMPEAEACWRRTIELKPDCTDAYSNLGMMLYEKKRIAEAADIVQAMAAAGPGEPRRPPHGGRLHRPGRAGAGRRRVRPQQLRSFCPDVRRKAPSGSTIVPPNWSWRRWPRRLAIPRENWRSWMPAAEPVGAGRCCGPMPGG